MANSTSEAVGDAAKTGVDAIGITSGSPATAVPSVKRKTPQVPEGDTLGIPQFVISVGEEGEIERITAETFLSKYPVAVTIVTADGMKAADDATVRQWRQQIRQRLLTPSVWSGISGFNGVDLSSKAPFDQSALSKDFNFATIIVTVEVLEALP